MSLLTRRAKFLTIQQRRVFDEVLRFYDATGEPASAAYLARRLGRARQTITTQIGVLHRKGLLRAPNPPAAPLEVPGEIRSTAPNAGRIASRAR